ncbi:MAG: 5'-nucleotidase C-terminal domain-containing protein [Prevotella sp.]|nr:5'-nucleotidase C-terminal domain-containing protein [Prevotella sp.]
MKFRHFLGAFLAYGAMLASCSSHYELAGISRSRILIDQRYDQHVDAEATAFLAPYKEKVDSIMSPVMGTAARDMDKHRPESEISNLLADILVWAGKDYGEQPELAVYNIGGIRAAISKGTVTYGDINDVAPFENKITFLSLTGTQLTELFRQIAQTGGEGVSHGVELVIGGDGQLISAKLHGKDINPASSYRVVTLDYLAQGNDGLVAFRDGSNVVSPQAEQDNARYLIMNYFKAMQAQGKAVDAQVEGRIKIVR